MKKEKVDRVVQEMMDSPLIRHIISSLNPDMDKLRKAVTATLREIGQIAEEELRKDWEDAQLGSVTEKMAMANALGVPFKKMWPQTYLHISEMIATAGWSNKPRKKRLNSR